MQTATITFRPFNHLQDDACHERIRAASAKLGKRAVMLCHHYQRADVYQHADLTGDSLKLSRLASQTDAEYIVFCGVHFMAEVADIMSQAGADGDPARSGSRLLDGRHGQSGQGRALLARAGRSAGRRRAGHAGHLHQLGRRPQGLLRRAWRHRLHLVERRKIADWAFARREKILFFPDQHLGRWTGHKMGIPLDEMVVWDPDLEMGGLTPSRSASAKMLLWKGHCSVHQMFQPAHILNFRNQHPDGTGHLAPRMQLRSLPAVGFRRLDRTHPQDGQGSGAEHALAGRHRAQPG